MKILIIILAILFVKDLKAQRVTLNEVSIDSSVVKRIFYQEHDFYIDRVIDNRERKSMFWGHSSTPGYSEINHTVSKFKEDNFSNSIKKIFDCALPAEGKYPVIAKINYFHISEVSSSENVLSILIDIDFYKSTSSTDSIQVGHYHGRHRQVIVEENIKTKYGEMVFIILSKSLKSIGNIEINSFKKANYLDTTYIPKPGFYPTVFDYMYNTPLQFGCKFKKSLNYDEISLPFYKIKSSCDSVNMPMFGYSDGMNFYAFANGNIFSDKYKIVEPKGGRFLLIGNNETNFVYDVMEKDFYVAESLYFHSMFKQDESIYLEYIKSKKKRKDLLKALIKLNRLNINADSQK